MFLSSFLFWPIVWYNEIKVLIQLNFLVHDYLNLNLLWDELSCKIEMNFIWGLICESIVSNPDWQGTEAGSCQSSQGKEAKN